MANPLDFLDKALARSARRVEAERTRAVAPNFNTGNHALPDGTVKPAVKALATDTPAKPQKPPLGVMPRNLWLEARLADLVAAQERRNFAGYGPGEHDLTGEIEQIRAELEIGPLAGVPHAMQVLRDAMTKDPGYVTSWAANLAMAYFDEVVRTREQEGLPLGPLGRMGVHGTANRAAAAFMQMCFGVTPPEGEKQVPIVKVTVDSAAGHSHDAFAMLVAEYNRRRDGEGHKAYNALGEFFGENLIDNYSLSRKRLLETLPIAPARRPLVPKLIQAANTTKGASDGTEEAATQGTAAQEGGQGTAAQEGSQPEAGR